MQTLGKPNSVLDFASHLLLPAMVLGLAGAAPLLRYTRASMLEALNGEYVVAAKAKGLKSNTVVIRHAFRNSLIPIITVIGLLLPGARGGRRDHRADLRLAGHGPARGPRRQRPRPALMMGVVLVIGTAVLVTNILVDITYARADPRIHLDRCELTRRRSRSSAVEPTRPAGALRRFMRHRLAVIGIVILTIIVLLAVFADVVSSQPFRHRRQGRQPATQRGAPPRHGPVRARRLGQGRPRRQDIARRRPRGGGDLRGDRDSPRRYRRN